MERRAAEEMSVASKEMERAAIVVGFFVILMSVLLVRLNSTNEQAGREKRVS